MYALTVLAVAGLLQAAPAPGKTPEETVRRIYATYAPRAKQVPLGTWLAADTLELWRAAEKRAARRDYSGVAPHHQHDRLVLGQDYRIENLSVTAGAAKGEVVASFTNFGEVATVVFQLRLEGGVWRVHDFAPRDDPKDTIRGALEATVAMKSDAEVEAELDRLDALERADAGVAASDAGAASGKR